MEEFMEEYHNRTGNIYKAMIEITHCCNLKCKHCYIDGRNKILDKNSLIEVIDLLYDKGVLLIVLTGGEIFSYPWFVEVYTYIKLKGFIVDLKTNALLLNDTIKTLLYKYPPHKIDISVYGLNNSDYGKFTGDYDGFSKLVNSLNWLYENEFSFQLTVMALQETYKDLSAGNYNDFFSRYNCNLEFEYDIIPNFGTNKISDVGLLTPKQVVFLERKSILYKEEIENAIPIKENTNLICNGGVKSIFIDVDGFLHICIFDDKKFIINDLKNNQHLLYERNREIIEMYKNSECSKCKNHIGCKRCPIRQKITLRSGTSSWRCELSMLRETLYYNNEF